MPTWVLGLTALTQYPLLNPFLKLSFIFGFFLIVGIVVTI